MISHLPDVSKLISDTLADWATVTHAKTVQEAYQLHMHNPFDIIFYDLNQLMVSESTGNYSKAAGQFVKINPLVQMVVLTTKETVREAVSVVKGGASDYLTYPIDEKEVLLVFNSLQEMASKDLELDYLRDRFWKSEWLDIIRTRNPTMRKLYDNLRSVAPTIATVLLLGETGTGKGLMARLIHLHSLRNEKPFIAVHCGAIPDTLLESELFGHERGAFTGADRRKIGKFELARGGTIFLDEIGTVTAPAQIKLLQVLQDGTFSRVGGTDILNTDARIIAATNENLEDLVEKKLFRKDLYYRLNVFPVRIPPLKDRLEDLPYLVDIFINQLNERYGKSVSGLHPEVEAGMHAYDWPGNIRELENIIERAFIVEKSTVLNPWSFPLELAADLPESPDLPEQENWTLAQCRKIAMDQFEDVYLKKLLRRFKGKINRSAEKAGITPRQLNRLIARHGLNKNDFKN